MSKLIKKLTRGTGLHLSFLARPWGVSGAEAGVKPGGRISQKGALLTREVPTSRKPGQSPLIRTTHARRSSPAPGMVEHISVPPMITMTWGQIQRGKGHHKPSGNTAEPTAGICSLGPPSAPCEGSWPWHPMPFKAEELSRKSPCS